MTASLPNPQSRFLEEASRSHTAPVAFRRPRFYNPATARFATLDPFGGDQQAPQSLHKYAYCHGDGVNGVDPKGLFGEFGFDATVFNPMAPCGLPGPAAKAIRASVAELFCEPDQDNRGLTSREQKFLEFFMISVLDRETTIKETLPNVRLWTLQNMRLGHVLDFE